MAQAKSFRERLSEFSDTAPGRFLILHGPIYVVLYLILLFPFLLEIYLSFSDWEPGRGEWWLAHFNYGLGFSRIFGDFRLWRSVGITFLIAAIAVGAEFSLGLIGAALFSRSFKGKRALTAMFLVPMFFMPVVVAYNFWMMFQPTGPINFIVGKMVGREVVYPWLSRAGSAFAALIITDIWQWTPFMFLILNAGMLSLPQTPIEAAKVLGASEWQIFRHIKLPMLKNIIIIALVIRFMEALKLFDTPYILTGGGPGFATETLSIYTYIVGVQTGRLGYGSSISMLLLILILLIISPAVRPILRRR
ncbi:MAG: carbohydrate ABC transporter permease [Candidatus Bathyarchaeia archaeon]